MIHCHSTKIFSNLLLFHLIFWAKIVLGQGPADRHSTPALSDAILHQAAQAVVKISTGTDVPTGAGIVIGKTRSGLAVILTSPAALNGRENKIMIQAASQAQPVPGSLISEKWRNRDLVLIAARKPLPVSAALAYGHSDQLALGADATALGFVTTQTLGQSTGQIVRSEASQILLNFIMPAGYTGGPLLDQNGYVVGIAVSRPQELSQAVPIDLARITVEQWLGKTQVADSWQEGKSTKSLANWLLAAGLLIATGIAVGVSGVF